MQYHFLNRSLPSRKMKRGFTLIELLIVIAIILILISIALPNFLEAQMRAKVAKVKGEIRTLAFAMEEYNLDWKVYPAENEPDGEARGRLERGLFWLTSPIKYISKLPEDPFINRSEGTKDKYYETGGVEKYTTDLRYIGCMVTWAIFTRGPDMAEGDIKSQAPHYYNADDGSIDSYSPTNGSRSNGDIFQYGGDGRWIGVATGTAKGNPNAWPATPLIVDWEPYLHRLPPKLR